MSGSTGGSFRGVEVLLPRAPIRGNIHGAAVPDSYKKILSAFCDVFRSENCDLNKTTPKSLKSIGYLCKSYKIFGSIFKNEFIFYCFLLMDYQLLDEAQNHQNQ